MRPDPTARTCTGTGTGSRPPSRSKPTRRPTGAEVATAGEYAFEPEHYKQRHAVERGISKLKRYRAVATRYGKHAVRYQSTVQIAAINDWL